MKTISSILKSFSSNSINKFNLVLSRAEKDLSKAFIDICIESFNLIESNIKEDESLKAYRQEWNDTFKELNITNSSFTFANMLKIGNIASKDKAWLLGFKNVTCLAIGLASMQSVPACNGISALEIVTTNKADKPIAETIKEIPNTLESKELREKVNLLKGIPVKADKILKPINDDSKPVNNSLEQSALKMAQALIANINQDKAYLLAFTANIYNLNQELSARLADEFSVLNKSKRVNLSVN